MHALSSGSRPASSSLASLPAIPLAALATASARHCEPGIGALGGTAVNGTAVDGTAVDGTAVDGTAVNEDVPSPASASASASPVTIGIHMSARPASSSLASWEIHREIHRVSDACTS